jgi:hypothetical protein
MRYQYAKLANSAKKEPWLHANIDRLWVCWQLANVTLPGPWQDQMFSFVDETGALVTRPVKDLLDANMAVQQAAD